MKPPKIVDLVQEMFDCIDQFLIECDEHTENNNTIIIFDKKCLQPIINRMAKLYQQVK